MRVQAGAALASKKGTYGTSSCSAQTRPNLPNLPNLPVSRCFPLSPSRSLLSEYISPRAPPTMRGVTGPAGTPPGRRVVYVGPGGVRASVAVVGSKRQWAPSEWQEIDGLLEAFTPAPGEPIESAALCADVLAHLQLMTPSSARLNCTGTPTAAARMKCCTRINYI